MKSKKKNKSRKKGNNTKNIVDIEPTEKKNVSERVPMIIDIPYATRSRHEPNTTYRELKKKLDNGEHILVFNTDGSFNKKMEKARIEEGNKLIAEFMEMPFVDGYYKNTCDSPLFLNYSRPLEELEFNQSWDWLMPVIKKCNQVKSPSQHGGWSKFDRITSVINPNHFFNDDISEVWQCVIEFITWYNRELEANKK